MFKNKTMNIKIIFKSIKNMLKYFMFSKHLFCKTLKNKFQKSFLKIIFEIIFQTESNFFYFYFLFKLKVEIASQD